MRRGHPLHTEILRISLELPEQLLLAVHSAL
nr:MAG TPA: hypothetical protein [Caudoviricetes sp.]